jgi:hypothetical protein
LSWDEQWNILNFQRNDSVAATTATNFTITGLTAMLLIALLLKPFKEEMAIEDSNVVRVTTLINDTYLATGFINEIHYDNAGSDIDEEGEIAGLAGTDLTGMENHTTVMNLGQVTLNRKLLSNYSQSVNSLRNSISTAGLGNGYTLTEL